MKNGLLIVCFLISFTSFSQEKKLEKEERIKASGVPDAVKSLIAPYTEGARRVRYYSEFNGTTKSFEVKFVLYKNHFSVEFSKDGQLEDVEVIRCFTELPKNVQDEIVKYLYPNDNFKIKKNQKQFLSKKIPDSEVLDAAIKNQDITKIRYELIVQIKKEGEWTTFEMLFDEDGKFVSQREVIDRSEDHLLY